MRTFSLVGDKIVDDAEHGEPLRLHENLHLHMLEETDRSVSAYSLYNTVSALTLSQPLHRHWKQMRVA